MPTDSEQRESATWLGRVLSTLIALGSALYLCLIWVQIQPWMPEWLRHMRNGFLRLFGRAVNATVLALGGSPPNYRWMWAILSLIMGLAVPWIVMAVLGRGHPRDLGLRRPNRIGWRLIAATYVLALPWLFVMSRSPATRSYYGAEFNQSLRQLIGTYLSVLLAEHFMFHGVLLALLRPSRRWPTVPQPAPVEGNTPIRCLRWVGLAQPAGDARGLSAATRWIGLPDHCLWALVLQAVLFGLVHLGKAPIELAFSFPGGLILGYVAYRCNSLVVPTLLHVTTGLTAVAMIRLL